jgi:hypothetical protein
MKIFQRILIILGLSALMALVTWAAVTVISIANLPTDTMDFTAPITQEMSIPTSGFMGYIKPLLMISLVVIIEQFLENLFSKKKKRAKAINAL